MNNVKTFTRAGISTNKGESLFRFTTSPTREKILIDAGHTDILFFELDTPLSKPDAIAFLGTKGLVEDRKAKEVKAPKAPKAVKPAQVVAVDDSNDSPAVAKLIAAARVNFPSHTDAQLREIVQYQSEKAIGPVAQAAQDDAAEEAAAAEDAAEIADALATEVAS